MKRSPNASSYQMRRRKTCRWPAAGGGCRTTTATSSQTSSGRSTRTSWRTTAPSSQSAAAGGETLNWGPNQWVAVEEDTIVTFGSREELLWLLTAYTVLSKQEHICVFFNLIIMCFDFPHVQSVFLLPLHNGAYVVQWEAGALTILLQRWSHEYSKIPPSQAFGPFLSNIF